MTLIEKASEALHRRRWFALALGLSLAGLLALIDLLTPEAISFSLFYLLPIALLEWYSRRGWPWLAAATGAFLWPVDHLLRGNMVYFNSLMAFWEPAMRVGLYALFIGFLKMIHGYIGRLRDVNRDLHESEERYREVFENTSDGIFLIDVLPENTFRVAAYNPAMERMVGLSNEQVAGKLNQEFLPPETAESVKENNLRCLAAGTAISFDEELDLPAGRFLWHTTLVPVHDALGEIYRLVGMSRDVTATVLAQRALQQSERKFATSFQSSPDSVTLSRVDDGILLEVNEVFTQVYGFSREEAVGHNATELGIWVYPEERHRLAALVRENGGATGFEATFRRRNGEIRHGMLSSRRVEIDGQSCMLNTARDMTEHRLMESRISESEQRYREIFENTSDGIFMVEVTLDDRFRLLSCNPAQERMMEIAAKEAVGKYIDEYLPSAIADTAVAQNRACIAAGRQMSFESSVDLDSGQTFFNTTLVPVRDETGRIARLVGVTQDLTERKRAEERERTHEQQLFQAAKLASLGTLVSGIAHEINNPNNFIRLNAQNLKKIWPDVRSILGRSAEADPDLTLGGVSFMTAREMVGDLLAGIEAGSNRIEKLVVNLRDFSRGDEGELKERVDVNAALESALMIIRDLIQKSTDTFVVNTTADLPLVLGSYQQIEQVIINLVTNACQALPSRDRCVAIATKTGTGGDSVVVEVVDEGNGIPAANLARITDPFFTTKRSRGGSGLGLAVSSRIVANHGGRLSFHSEVGVGTRATVELPLGPERFGGPSSGRFKSSPLPGPG